MSGRIRPQRVGDFLRIELSSIIAEEVRDPRVGLVSVTGVQVSNDLSVAKVFLSCVDPAADVDEIIAVLEGAKGFIRTQLARRKLGLRQVPELRFHPDRSVAAGTRIDEILRDLDDQGEDDA